MGTIVAIDCSDGALLAGDRVVVRNGTAVGSRRHVFAFEVDDVVAAAVGDDPDSFRRRLDVALRGYATERGAPPVEAVARMAVDIAGESGVEAFVVAPSDDGRARVRSVANGVLDESMAAFGSASAIVLGQLDADIGEDAEVSVDDAEARVLQAFETAASRDAGTGEEVDVSFVVDGERPGKRFSPSRGSE